MALLDIADFHTHILPAMDDGSPDAATSLSMLSESSRQGVRTVVATPHFYPEQERPNDFLARRARAVDRLLDGGYDAKLHPRVLVGAEVAYFPGLSRCEELEQFCIVGTSTMLVEMPFAGWSNAVIEEVLDLRARRSLIPVLAHIERYAESRDRVLLRTLLEEGIVLQISADMMGHMLSRRRALRWLEEQAVQLIGSDCHNLTTRAPDMQTAYECLASRASGQTLDRLTAFGRFVLDGAASIQEL